MITHLQDWLTLQADQRPEAVAIVFRETAVTYQELEQNSNRLAHALQAAGCRPGDRVGLLLPKGPPALVAMFAALKADCIYVPLDTASPARRIGGILQLCECRCLLADRSSAGLLDQLMAQPTWLPSTAIGWLDNSSSSTIPVRFHWDDVQALPDSPLNSHSSSEQPAHILFTSGSTGVPKGVIITHSNVIHFVQWAVDYFGMGPSDRVSGHPPLHFDLSTFDVYGAVAAGSQLHLLPPETSILPHRLAEFIRSSHLTQWFSVPSVLHTMARFVAVRQDDFPSLKRLLWCGEKFPTPALIHWMSRLPHVTFDNLYGPTETTIASSYYRVPRCPDDDKAEIPIGAPCTGERLLVLDEQLHPTRPGDVGDLYIGGVGLSPGYWKDPEKTAQAFLPDPSSSVRGDRIYKTGDLARIGPDGLIYLLGRADTQIKSRGYRIELGEIETALHTVPGVRDAAVVAIDSPEGESKVICCAYVPDTDSARSPVTLRKGLAQVLPPYMIPAHWRVLQDLPQNGNGKVDRPLLKEWFGQATAVHNARWNSAGGTE